MGLLRRVHVTQWRRSFRFVTAPVFHLAAAPHYRSAVSRSSAAAGRPSICAPPPASCLPAWIRARLRLQSLEGRACVRACSSPRAIGQLAGCCTPPPLSGVRWVEFFCALGPILCPAPSRARRGACLLPIRWTVATAVCVSNRIRHWLISDTFDQRSTWRVCRLSDFSRIR